MSQRHFLLGTHREEGESVRKHQDTHKRQKTDTERQPRAVTGDGHEFSQGSGSFPLP